MTNTVLRKTMLAQRKTMKYEQVSLSSHCICDKIIKSKDFQNAKTIMVYFPCNKEVDLREVIESAWKYGKEVAFPKVNNNNTMEFYTVRSYDQLESGFFGIMEPDKNCPLFIPKSHTAMYVPGTAFGITKQGIARIGYGKGYYDIYLKQYRTKLTTYAVAYDFQINNESQITMYSHDQYIDHLITPTITI